MLKPELIYILESNTRKAEILKMYCWQALFLLASLAIAKVITATTTITRTVAYRTSTTTISRTRSLAAGSEETTTSGSAPSASAMPGGGPYSSSDLRASVLNSTNHYRSQFLAKPLSWDSTLAAYAHSHAQNCIWEHSVRLLSVSGRVIAILTVRRAVLTARTWH